MGVASDSEFAGIPDKLYFKIGEVCELTGVKSHTLRYWEAEFAILRPQRAVSKQRLYRRVDVENILRIKRFIQDDGLTMAGVKKQLAKLKNEGKGSGVAIAAPPVQVAEVPAAVTSAPPVSPPPAEKTGVPEQGLLFAVLPPRMEAGAGLAGQGSPKGMDLVAGERKLYQRLKAELLALQKTLKP